MKRIVLMVLVASTILLGQLDQSGYNVVVNNKLESSEYSFAQFSQDYLVGDRFLCIDNYEYWGKGVEFKSIFEITKLKDSSLVVKSPKTGLTIKIDESNFGKFYSSFIGGDCLIFSRKFPVKFYKVKTAVEESNQLIFRKSPQGEPIEKKAGTNVLFYYAYKQKEINNAKYVLLGKRKKFDPDVSSEIDRILGWVKYRNKNNRPENMVLWNTNIGIRPGESGEYDPIISKKQYPEAVKKYYKSKSTPSKKKLLVSQSNIESYRNRFQRKHAQINRWLPKYTMADSLPNYMTEVGVIEDMGVIRRDIENIVTMNEIQIALLIDNSGTMSPVWDNLHTTIEQTLNTLTSSNFINAAGDTIKPKLKIYYYSDTVQVLNNDKWITSVQDIYQYHKVIKSINTRRTKYWRPHISRSFTKVINDLGDEPVFVVVIGSSGDKKYQNKAFSQIPKFRRSSSDNLIMVKGIRYNSGLANDNFKEAHEQFAENFEIIHDVKQPRLNKGKAIFLGAQIGESIINSTQNLIIDLKSNILSGEKSRNIDYKTKSAFTLNYLKSVRDAIVNTTGGTFFEEGNILMETPSGNSLVNKDVLVEKSKLATLKGACHDYNHNRTVPQFRIAIRQILSSFFEIDYWSVDVNFLQKIHLSDFWVRVVGNEEIAKKIAPKLFEEDPSFKEIFDNIGKYQEQINKNVKYIENNITRHFNSPYPGKFSILTNTEKSEDQVKGIVEQYYWVDVEELNLFKNIKFEE